MRISRGIGNGDGEEAGILVVHVDEIDAVIRTKGREPETLPVEQILRYGQGDPWAFGRKRRVRHHVALERFDKRDARIFAATTAVGPPLVVGFRLERDAEPLDAARIAGLIEPHARDADARVVAPRDEPRKQVELTIRPTNGRRIQDAFDLLRDCPVPAPSTSQAAATEIRSSNPFRDWHASRGHRPPAKQAMIAFNHPLGLIGILGPGSKRRQLASAG